MSSSFALSNAEILRATLNAAGLGRDYTHMDDATEADLRAIVRAGLRRATYPLVGEFPYQWRFLERYHSISCVDKYTTGTVAIAGGVITGVGTTFPSWAADAFMAVDGHMVFVETRVGNTGLTTTHSELTVASGSTYELWRYRYALPSNFAEWTGGVTYSNGPDNWILAGASEADLRLRYSVNYNYNNRTSHYAITAAPSGVFNMTLWPVPQKDAFIRGVYISAPEDNLAADLRVPDVTPIIQAAPIYAEAFLEAILAAAEAYNDDAIGIHEQRYQTALAAAIAHDKSASDGFDFSNDLGRRPAYRPYPSSIDFSGAL